MGGEPMIHISAFMVHEMVEFAHVGAAQLVKHP